jgi:hypothetical protein
MSEEDEIYQEIAAFGLEDGIPPAFSGSIEELQQIERPVNKMPADIADESGISGLLFTHQMCELLDVAEIELTDEMYWGQAVCAYVEEARALAPQIDGAPILEDTYIQIQISDESEAGSQADCIWVTFGTENWVTFSLLGDENQKFAPGLTLEWWLDTDYRPYAERIPTDGWDDITLRNPFDDPMKIEHIRIVHSGEAILDRQYDCWLDRSKERPYSKLGLGADILTKKLLAVYPIDIPQLHWAAHERGKTDGRKYGALDAWSSEFAAWCLRKGLWGPPRGVIDSGDMEGHFDMYGRMYTKQQVLDGEYVLTPGDYLRCYVPEEGGHVSALLVRYLGIPGQPNDNSTIQTIQGNTAGRVAVRARTLGDLRSVGSTR